MYLIMPKPGRNATPTKRIDRSKQSIVKSEDVKTTVDTEKIFQSIVLGKSIASISRELKIPSKRVSELIRKSLSEISLDIAELRHQYTHQTLHQIDYLIEVGLNMIASATKEDAGLYKMVAGVYLDLVKARREILGNPVTAPNPDSPASINDNRVQIMNIGPVTPTISNTKEDPLMQGVDANFFAKAFKDKHGGAVETYVSDQFGIEDLDDDNPLKLLESKLKDPIKLPDDDEDDE